MTLSFTKLFFFLSAVALPLGIESFLSYSSCSKQRIQSNYKSLESFPVRVIDFDNSNARKILAEKSTLSSTEKSQDLSEDEKSMESPKAKSGKGVGFGTKPKNVVKQIKKSKAALEREAAAETYDAQKKSGIPEYSIFLRELSNDDEERWLPVGSMTIPRSTKVENALFENEESLIKGALRLFPKTDLSGGVEYGYNLKAYPDEPIRIAERPKSDKNLFMKYIENAMNPLNASDMGKKED